MQEDTAISPSLIDWGVAWRPLPGQHVCGDMHLVKTLSDGVLLAVVDGLGHGDEAVVASKTAVRVLERHAEDTLVGLFHRCHLELHRTRGVVMTAAVLHEGENRLNWMGVGNVEAVLVHAHRSSRPASERVLLRNGIVGYRLPELRLSSPPIAPDDLLIFATDGIGPGFAEGLVLDDPPQRIADRILKRHVKPWDDALVLVVRYVGSDHE